jgi:hypothetical protein
MTFFKKHMGIISLLLQSHHKNNNTIYVFSFVTICIKICIEFYNNNGKICIEVNGYLYPFIIYLL